MPDDEGDQVRMTVRLPAAAARYLDHEAKENFTSRNAEIVRVVRAAMKANGPASVGALPGPGSSNSRKEKADEHGKQ